MQKKERMLSNGNSNNNIVKGMLRQVMIMTSLAGFVTMLGALVDNILVGRFMGADCVSASGLISPLLLMCIAVSSVLMSGGQINVSRRIGAGKLKEANQIFSLVMSSIFVIASIIGVLLFVFCTPIAGVLGASKSPEILMPLTSDYVKGIAIGMPAVMIMFCMSPYLQIDGDNIRLLSSMLVMLISNVIGDITAIFVIKSQAHGMFFIALATSISNILGLIVILTHFLSKNSTFRFSFAGLEFKELKSVLGLGAPTGLQRTYSTVANLLMNLIVLSVAGVVGNAAQAVRGNVSALFLTLGSSLGSATLTVASLMYGEEDKEGLKNTEKTAIYMSLKITITLAVIMFVFAGNISKIFLGQDQEANVIATQAIRLFAFALPFSSICDILFGYYQAITKSVLANIIPMLEYLVFPVGLSFVMGHSSLGATGIWIAYPIAEVLTIMALFVIVSVKEKRLIVNISGLALIPDGFGVSEENVLGRIITDLDGAMEVSRAAFDFCKDKSGDDKRASVISLVIEEMVKNIIEHGFEGVSNPNVILKLIWKNDRFLLCIRDNCKPFNPKEKAAILKNSGATDKFGLSLVFGLVSDIEYTNILNMNNVRISD